METTDPRAGRRPPVSAVILHFHRERFLALVLDRLATLPLHEILVVDNGSAGLDSVVAGRERVRVIEPGGNIGIAGRNLGAEEAEGEILLMLDDDSYPLPGAIEAALDAFEREPRLGAIGGLVRDVDDCGRVADVDSAGSFDWFLRAGQGGEPPPTGFPAFFFPACASFFRRSAYVEAHGYFEPLFLGSPELDLATRLIGGGWDVRYLPAAVFDHHKTALAGDRLRTRLELRVRNQIWYFWLRFPSSLAARRIPAYLAFDFVECAYRGALGAWLRGVVDAWQLRETVSNARSPLSREAIRRAELNRGRMHVRLLAAKLTEKLWHRR